MGRWDEMMTVSTFETPLGMHVREIRRVIEGMCFSWGRTMVSGMRYAKRGLET